jgi:tetratricopeptide (TPR) repeat protein
MERVKARRWADAEADFSYALDHGGHAPSANFGRGMVRVRLGRYAEAEKDLTAAIDDGVDEDLAHYFRAFARLELARYRAALADLDRALAKEPRDLSALQLRALVRARLGRAADAERDCIEAERIGPQHAGTHGARGFVHLARREFREAAASFRKARGRSFGKGWRFEAGLATLLSGDFEGASREYETGLLRATDTDIDDALRELAFWTGRHGLARRAGFRGAIRRIRRRLREVRASER